MFYINLPRKGWETKYDFQNNSKQSIGKLRIWNKDNRLKEKRAYKKLVGNFK